MRTPNPNQAHASISTTGTASTLADAGYVIHEKTATLLVQVIGGNVRMTLNGTDPTASSGIQLIDGTTIELGSVEAGVAKFITESGTPVLEIAAYVR